MELFLLSIGLFIAIAYIVDKWPKRRQPTRLERVANIIELAAPIVMQVAVIIWSQVALWFEQNREPGTIGKLIRQNVDNGDVTVIANVLRGSQTTASNTWRAQALDPDLERQFGNRNEIVVYS